MKKNFLIVMCLMIMCSRNMLLKLKTDFIMLLYLHCDKSRLPYVPVMLVMR